MTSSNHSLHRITYDIDLQLQLRLHVSYPATLYLIKYKLRSFFCNIKTTNFAPIQVLPPYEKCYINGTAEIVWMPQYQWNIPGPLLLTWINLNSSMDE